jgi:hypothetical protein
VSDQRPLGRAVTVLSAGVVIGLVEVILAVAFATLVFGGFLVRFWANGIGLCLMGAAITMGRIGAGRSRYSFPLLGVR